MSDITDEIEQLRLVVSDMEQSIPKLIEGARQPLLQEIERLQTLLGEVIPYLLHDVECAIQMGPMPVGHEDDDCEDCRWYRKAVAWKSRIDAGELGDVSNF